MNNLVNFEGQEVKVKTDKGNTLVNLVHTAKCCGLNKFETRVGRTTESIRWARVSEKLNNICGTDVPTQYLEEIKYILDEIENTDDRNSIYMSSWLSKRLALECHSDRAMRYKSFLVSLDEARENGALTINNADVSTVVGQVVNQIIPTLTEQLALQVVPTMVETKNQVNNMVGLMHDQSAIYDQDREDLKSLIGFRAVNTKKLTDKLKEDLSEHLGIEVTANSSYYKKAKKKVFKEFGVIKWEDIPATKFNAVHAYIEEIVQV